MDISSKRFNVKSDGFGGVTVRDRNAPYHSRTVKLSDLPTVNEMALMKEADFDRALAETIYGGEGQ